MDGLSLAELESRHAECVAARKNLARDYEVKDMGFAYVLGEYEVLMGLLRERAAAEAEREALAEEAERAALAAEAARVAAETVAVAKPVEAESVEATNLDPEVARPSRTKGSE